MLPRFCGLSPVNPPCLSFDCECSSYECHCSKKLPRQDRTGEEDSQEDRCVRWTYLDLGTTVPLGASGDENSPSVMVTGDHAGSMPSLPGLLLMYFAKCLLRPPPLSAIYWHPVHCFFVCGSFSLQSEDVASHYPSCSDKAD